MLTVFFPVYPGAGRGPAHEKKPSKARLICLNWIPACAGMIGVGEREEAIS